MPIPIKSSRLPTRSAALVAAVVVGFALTSEWHAWSTNQPEPPLISLVSAANLRAWEPTAASSGDQRRFSHNKWALAPNAETNAEMMPDISLPDDSVSLQPPILSPLAEPSPAPSSFAEFRNALTGLNGNRESMDFMVNDRAPDVSVLPLRHHGEPPPSTTQRQAIAETSDHNAFDPEAFRTTATPESASTHPAETPRNRPFPMLPRPARADLQATDTPTLPLQVNRIASDQPNSRDRPKQGLEASVRPVAGVTPITPAQSPPADSLPKVLHNADQFQLAAAPPAGAHYRDPRPVTGATAHLIETLPFDFSPDPTYDHIPYQPDVERQVYEGKRLHANQRPLIELGRPWYQLGPLSPGYDWFGRHNNIAPQFLVYGDFRTSIASNTAGGNNTSQLAYELNLDLDLKLTSTERFHAFLSPLDDGVNNTRYLLDDNDWEDQLDANFDFGYFEGDLGSMLGGLVGETMPFDLPFSVGVMPLLFQNGVWMEDALLGVAATVPARSSARWNISNMDLTLFAGFDKVNSGAFPGDDSAARIYGFASFIEALNGYLEIDYAFLEDRTLDDRSYHNFGLGYSRRIGRLVSNSTRLIVNAGQSSDVVANTADGVLLLSENSLITGAPSTVVPYFNLFAGFDRPQSAARAVQAGGVLRNTGILFESDGMTNYPTLDATGNDTFGAALGLNLIASDFSQQLVIELAMLGVMGEDTTRNAAGEQAGLGLRYQLPLSNSLIFRADGMYGFLTDQEDVRGLRFELRQKW